MIVRKMNLNDIEKVVDINIACWKRVYKGIIDDSYLASIDREGRIKRNIEKLKESNNVVAEIEGEVVGFCRYDNSRDSQEYDCEIIALYVNPDKLKQGIGKAMFEYVVDEFKNQGKKKMIIWCLKENYNSRKFYEKMGGKIVGEKMAEIGEKSYIEVGFGYDI